MSILNFRDLKGYQNKEGKHIKEGMLFRGGALDHLTNEDIHHFKEDCAIDHILDFRDEKEAELAEDYRFDTIAYERIPALKVKEHDANGFDFGEIIKSHMDPSMLEGIVSYLKEGYRTMPFDNEAYRRMFEILLKGEHLYFHCTAGKDRTGVATFLIMIALDMKEEDAMKEYLLSNEYLKKDDRLSKKLSIPEEYRALFEPLLFVDASFLQTTIDAIKEKYESYDQFLEKEYQLDRTKRDDLISIYCE